MVASSGRKLGASRPRATLAGNIGKPDTLDRVAQAMIALAALLALANGGVMLAVPLGWYVAVPTVRFTGLPNPQFIRDIGLAYLTCGVVLAYAASCPAGYLHAALAGLFYMARIGATLAEDCGHCALTAARGALDDGVPRDLVNQALAAAPLTGDLTTAFDFGRAIANHSSDAATLGDAIEAAHGRTVLLELAVPPPPSAPIRR